MDVKTSSHQSQGRSSCLTYEEEKCFVQHLQILGKCGFPFDRKDVLNLVENYLITNVQAKSLFPSGKPGVEWIRVFERRWEKESDKRKAELLTKSRAADQNEEITTAYFNTYEKLLRDNNLLNEPDRIFNLDEADLETDTKASKVFFAKESTHSIFEVCRL